MLRGYTARRAQREERERSLLEEWLSLRAHFAERLEAMPLLRLLPHLKR